MMELSERFYVSKDTEGHDNIDEIIAEANKDSFKNLKLLVT